MAVRQTIDPPAYRRIVQITLFFVTAIIVTGASVRLSGSGLGCPTWPRCTSTQMVDISSPHRAVEQINRLFTGGVTVACAVAFSGAFLRRPYRRDLAWFGALLVAGVLLQAVIGGIVVLLELQWESVALHFIASFVLLYGNLELLRRAGAGPGPRTLCVPITIRRHTETVFGLLLVVLALGTVVTGAGPHGGDAHVRRLDWPVEDAARLHSIAVWVLVATTLWLAARLQRLGLREQFDRAGTLVAAMVFQGAVGYVQWFNRVPPVLVGIHVLGAALVFMAATQLRFGSFVAPPEIIAVESTATATA